MSLFTNFSKVSCDSVTSIAIGGFDGLHKGHQELFSRLDKGGAVLAIENNHMDLTPKRERENFCKYPFFYLELDSVMKLSGREFVELLEKTFVNLKRVVVGYDFKFGNNRSCDAIDLISMFAYEVVIVNEVKVDGISVHSRNIRNYIRLGEIQKANKLLGREYLIQGEIIKGQGLGMRKLYPTLNLEVKRYLIPNEGVYATTTKVDDKLYPSVSFIGHRVSTDGSFAVETHILIEDEDFSCEAAEIIFVEKMRDNRYFDKLEDLKAQISQDIADAKRALLL